MPKFLTRPELYRVLQRELPPNVYPDGAPSGYYSTADMDSVAAVAASGYINLSKIYDEYWPQTSTERIGDWEITAFGKRLDPSLTLAERRDRVLVKFRSRKGLTKRDMKEIVQSIIGTDKVIDISEWGCSSGGWLIGESQLGIETILGGYRRGNVSGPLICEASPSDYGYTQQQWDDLREDAYTYQVNIYAYTLTNAEREAIDEALLIGEPARSNHVIVDGLDLADILDPNMPINLDVGDGDIIGTGDGDELII